MQKNFKLMTLLTKNFNIVYKGLIKIKLEEIC